MLYFTLMCIKQQEPGKTGKHYVNFSVNYVNIC